MKIVNIYRYILSIIKNIANAELYKPIIIVLTQIKLCLYNVSYEYSNLYLLTTNFLHSCTLLMTCL